MTVLSDIARIRRERGLAPAKDPMAVRLHSEVALAQEGLEEFGEGWSVACWRNWAESVLWLADREGIEVDPEARRWLESLAAGEGAGHE